MLFEPEKCLRATGSLHSNDSEFLLLKRCKTEQNPQKSEADRYIPQQMRPHGKHRPSLESCQGTSIGNDGLNTQNFGKHESSVSSNEVEPCENCHVTSCQNGKNCWTTVPMNNVVDCLRQHAWAKEIRSNGRQEKGFTTITNYIVTLR